MRVVRRLKSGGRAGADRRAAALALGGCRQRPNTAVCLIVSVNVPVTPSLVVAHDPIHLAAVGGA